MKWTICWNTDISNLNTLCISGITFFKYPHNVKNISLLVNQPVTNNSVFKNNNINLVGTSETIRPLSSKASNQSNSDLNWNQWLAGLIDGDGSLLVSKTGNTSCEITMSLYDEHALAQIKKNFGGSIKLRSGVKALRYRLHHKEGMIALINCINGNIRHSARFTQLAKVCSIFKLPLVSPNLLSYNDGWFAGLFDSDGTISYSFKHNNPQLTISVSNKFKENINGFTERFGGNIYFDKSGYGSFKWSIQSKSDILNFLNYIKIVPSRSHKRQRIFLVKQFFDLKQIQAYNCDTSSTLYKAWVYFDNKWTNRG